MAYNHLQQSDSHDTYHHTGTPSHDTYHHTGTPSHDTHHHTGTPSLPSHTVHLLVWGHRSVLEPLVNIGEFLDAVLEFVKRRKVVEKRRRVCLQSLQ